MTTATAAGMTAARTLYRTDWDEHGTTSIYMPRDIARRLLEARGWTRKTDAWHSPDGTRYWETDEALQIALTAEALS